MALVQLKDVIVPQQFAGYAQSKTKEISKLIGSGIVQADPVLTALLAGGGNTFHVPFFKDLDNDDADIMTDDAPGVNDSVPSKLGAGEEIGVRLLRHKSWSSNNLVNNLIAEDPMDAVSTRAAAYWDRQLQRAFVATMKGIFAAPSSTSMTVEVTTSITAGDVINASLLMGDALDDLKNMVVNSVVYGRLQKANLIQYIPNARGEITIPTYLGRTLVVDDAVPFDSTTGKYETWLLGNGAFRFGDVAPADAAEIERFASAGQGAGVDVLHNRVNWCLHPVGYKYVGPASKGGPSNAQLADSGSWVRVAPERKQVAIVRLVTKEA